MFFNDILEAPAQRTFKPFRIYLSDGAAYLIRHPDAIMVTPSSLIVGVPHANRPSPAIERFHIINLAQVTRLEPIESETVTG